MVIYKLAKTGNAVFYSHHDLMRIFLLCLNRAGIDVKRSRAGVPQVFFSTATCIGVSSVSEFVEIDTNLSAHKLAETIKTYLPDGISILAEYDTKSRLFVSKIACLAKYEVEYAFSEELQSKITKILSSDDFEVFTKMNNEVNSCNVKKMIHNFYFDKGKLYIIASVGENSLNIVQTIHQIFSKLRVQPKDLIVKKINLFAKIDGRFHDIELLALRNSK